MVGQHHTIFIVRLPTLSQMQASRPFCVCECMFSQQKKISVFFKEIIDSIDTGFALFLSFLEKIDFLPIKCVHYHWYVNVKLLVSLDY